MDRLGNYLLLRRLATGGLCEVYLARGGSPSCAVVIKRLQPELAASAAVRKAFSQLAQEARALQHENLLQVLEVGEEADVPYLVSLNQPGSTLEEVQEQVRKQGLVLPHGLVCSLLTQTCRALHYLHHQTGPGPLLHRGLRPSNLHLGHDGTLRLLDAGMQRVRQLASLDKPELLAGRYEYSSPEQCGGVAEEIRSDIFSAGVLLYELIARRRLFRRQSELATRRALLHDPITPPAKVAAGIPFELEQIALRALARQPEGRYADAQQMEQDLIAAARAHGWEAGAGAAVGFLSLLFPEAARPSGSYGEEEATVVPDLASYQAEAPPRIEGYSAPLPAASGKSADKITLKVPALADVSELAADEDEEDYGDEDQTLVQPPVFLAEGQVSLPDGRVALLAPLVHAAREEETSAAAGGPRLPLPLQQPPGRDGIEEASVPAAGRWGPAASLPGETSVGIEEASIPAVFGSAVLRPALSPPAPPADPARPRTPGRLPLVGLLAGGAALVLLVALLLLTQGKSAADENLTVLSEPAGAQVLLDGKLHPGRTPLTIYGLDPQRAYEVVLLAQGFSPFKTKLAPAQGGEARRIEATLGARGGGAAATLAVRVNVNGAQIYLDGELQGSAPLELMAVSCCMPHELLVRKDGFREQTLRLDGLTAGEQRRLEITLEPNVPVEAGPAGAAEPAARAR